MTTSRQLSPLTTNVKTVALQVCVLACDVLLILPNKQSNLKGVTSVQVLATWGSNNNVKKAAFKYSYLSLIFTVNEMNKLS